MRKLLTTIATSFLALGFLVSPADAAAFSAQKMIASSPATTLDQLEVYSYTIGFKNTGTESWTRGGTNAVSLKSTETIRTSHWFSSEQWIDKTTVTRATTDPVKPGEVGFFTMVLEAPTTARTFTNSYALFVGTKKIAGSDFSMTITVSSKVAAKTKQVLPATPALVSTSELPASTIAKAQLMIRSDKALTLKPGETKQVIVGFKNTGGRNWRNAAPSLVTLELLPTSANGKNVGSGWPNETTAAVLDQKLTEIGQLGYFTFSIKAPNDAVSTTLRFRMVLNAKETIPGGTLELPLTVTLPPTPPPPVLTQQPTTTAGIVCLATVDQSAQQQIGSEAGSCTPPHKEPILRVGIASVQGQLGVTAATPFIVLKDGAQVMEAPAGITVFLAYNTSSKEYTAIGPGPILTSTTPFVVKGKTDPSIITLVTFSNPAAFDTSLNDNIYRGSISVHWSENDEKLWIINELPMEDYLKGLAESGNSAPMEYQKALAIAARSYAMYHYQTNTKHAARHFHLVATVNDQYYRGYASELRIPNIGAAAAATRGQMVTYQGQVVITPYSASSDGMTRTWREVWGGSDKPWLVKKEVPEDKGRRKFGHAVGLSQLAAQDQAKAGKGYVDILKFFYVGTEVAQWYN